VSRLEYNAYIDGLVAGMEIRMELNTPPPLGPQVVPAHVVDELKATDAAQETKIAKNTSLLLDWSQFFATPNGKAIGGLIVTVLLLIVAWIKGAMNPTPVTPPVDPTTISKGIEASPIITPTMVPPANERSNRIVLYLTALPSEAVKAMPRDSAFSGMNLSIDPTVYPVGQAVKVNGVNVPMPCAVTFGIDGKALEAAQFTTKEELLKWLKKT
jgi:hypothetical protein